MVGVVYKTFFSSYSVIVNRPGEGSSEKNCCWWLMYKEPEQKKSSESSVCQLIVLEICSVEIELSV